VISVSGVQVALADRMRSALAVRGEEFLAEIPVAVRRIGLLMGVLAISVPVFLAGCLGVLAWWLLA
jgi:hypothetical protein